jgi:hypothetical protein
LSKPRFAAHPRRRSEPCRLDASPEVGATQMPAQ